MGSRGTTVVLSSHQLHEVEQVCDHVALLDRGRILASGTLDDLRARDRTTTVRLRAEPADVVEAVLRDAPVVLGKTRVATDDRAIDIAVEDGGLPDLVRRLVLADARVYEVAPRRASLEDAFFAIVSSGEGGGPGGGGLR